MGTNCTATYDLLLKGGHVIDPANAMDCRMDVAIGEGRIAEVAPDIPAEKAKKVALVPGLYVTPGLIDIHIHVTARHILADVVPLRTGSTTVVDAGSTGASDFESFKAKVVDAAKIRVLAFLNIAKCRMGRREQDPAEWDVIAATEMAERHRGTIVGIKTAHYRGPDFGPVDCAVHAGRLARIPVMVDIREKPTASYRDLLLKHLRPRDIVTHFYSTKHQLLDAEGRVQDHLWKARERGVVIDVGHGSESFWFRLAVPAVRQGLLPDSISTDLHRVSVLLPNATMPIVMSKFLNMGMTLSDVVRCSTVNPAREIGRVDLGTLSVGAGADVAVFELREGEFGFVDCGGARMRGRHRLECQMTIRNGEVIWDPNGLSMPDWESAGDYDIVGAEPLPRHDWPA